MPKNEKTIEDIYKKKSQHEHILSEPGMYIGSIESDQKEMWIYNDETDKIEKKIINFVPGFYKIFDEVLVNARDHSVRDKTCRTIRIDVNKESGEITVWNDGTGIPVVIHKEHKIYIPEMIFGQFLTSANYDQKGKTVGGKNGLGAKLANTLSRQFRIRTVDSKEGKQYEQIFRDNMYVREDPQIKKTKASSFTEISYIPDYERFGMKGMTNDILGLLKKRAYDMAVCTDIYVSVYFNGEKIKCKSFQDYIDLYYKTKPKLVYEKVNSRWRVGAIYDNDSGFNHIAFVNGIWTYHGGTHINHITQQIADNVEKSILQKHKNLKIRKSQIKENITLFIDCVIEDPDFNSQTKEYLTNKVSNFGTHKDAKCVLSNNFITRLLQTGIVEEVVSYSQFKEMNELTKTDGKKTESVRGIDKLEDAIWAGTRKSKETRLILTEGDSAKSFAVSGLSIIGRERFGVFPLKGKLLNVRNATPAQVKNNTEFINIKKIMGLKQGEQYTDISRLRYGGILILADQDDDGTHIKGLVLNMIEHFWPNLLAHNKDFVQTMCTPIIKAFKKSDKAKKDPIIFYNKVKYEDWAKNQALKNFVIKYYKGLGTSTEKEAKEHFKGYDKHTTSIVWEDAESDSDDDESADSNTVNKSKSHDALTLAFCKKRANHRKEWLYKFNRSVYLPYDQKAINISDFVNKDLIHFSDADNIRSIPSCCDGLKPSHRKILYAAFKRGANADEIKVAQFAGYVAQHTEYHHGEASLMGAIIDQAQNFPGSNNINYLVPSGNFGFRRQGGAEHASARYIFTEMEKITPKIFRPEDEPVLTHQYEDGMAIEPLTYAPIIPTVLVNGCKGIGTGFSTTIYPYNPIEIVENVKRIINKEEPEPMIPWYRGFAGKITPLADTKYEVSGVFKVIDEKTVHVTEIPIGTTIEKYVKFIDSITMTSKDDSKKVESYINRSGNNTIDISINFKGHELQKILKKDDIEKFLKLRTTISLTNFYLFDDKGTITKYDYVEDIMHDFYKYRLDMYKRRKEYMIALLKNELDIIQYKVKFIEDILAKRIVLDRKTRDSVLARLEELKYPKLAPKHTMPDSDRSYGYLTNMQLFSLTKEKIEELKREEEKRRVEYDDYVNTSVKQIWLRELDEFLMEYNKFLERTAESLDIMNTEKPKKQTKKKK